jgi:hypothetical protein
VRRWGVAALAAAFVVAGCAPSSGPDDGDPTTSAPAGTAAQDEADLPSADVDGQEVVLTTEDGARVLAVVDEREGQPVHATLRPGDEDHTVLVLTRVVEHGAARYELRYVVTTADEVSELFWFPWRLQVDEDTAATLDVAPTPVWAPDGSALAWVEWSAVGTRLRTVGWVDDGTSRNPSDETASYPLDEVPAGVQLHTWERAPDGDTVLVGSLDGQPYRIELDVGGEGPEVTPVGLPRTAGDDGAMRLTAGR